ncbi:hypothetical protein GE09DRAFT_1096787 [Coniochaeta sp. 2T2.1]|nr:hypothetical protein GE09DRAFT_1096787 [Coniochaeta sp. 2T2.1]
MAQPAQPNLFHYFHPVNARRQDAAAPDANLNPNDHPHPHPQPDLLPPNHCLHPNNVNPNANPPPQALPTPPPQPQPADEPRLWSLLHWPIWDFRFNLEARLSGLWTLISSHPDQQQAPFLQPPAPQKPRVIRMYTLPGTGLPDKERIFREVNLGRNEHTKYVAARTRYEDQVREHEFLRGWLRRTVAGDILQACCDEAADVREWYARIKAHVEGWKREADEATRQKRSRLAAKRKRKGDRPGGDRPMRSRSRRIQGQRQASQGPRCEEEGPRPSRRRGQNTAAGGARESAAGEGGQAEDGQERGGGGDTAV